LKETENNQPEKVGLEGVFVLLAFMGDRDRTLQLNFAKTARIVFYEFVVERRASNFRCRKRRPRRPRARVSLEVRADA
jgi:hypothetical protein